MARRGTRINGYNDAIPTFECKSCSAMVIFYGLCGNSVIEGGDRLKRLFHNEKYIIRSCLMMREVHKNELASSLDYSSSCAGVAD